MNFIESLSGWEQIIKKDLIQKGWNVSSVSLRRDSYLNNILHATIQVNVLPNDSSSRIRDGINNAIKYLTIGGERKFRDANLKVVIDTGNPSSSLNVSGSAGVTPKSPTVIDRGVVATVTVRASDSPMPEKPPDELVDFLNNYDTPSDSSKTYLVLGFLALVVLLRR